MAVQSGAHVVEVVGRELGRIVELVVVDQVAEPRDRPPDALGRRLMRVTIDPTAQIPRLVLRRPMRAPW
jgi:hypothetical protein